MPEVEKRRDKYYRVRVKRKVEGVWFSGTVTDIEKGATTKERLYKLRYDDGHLQHLTLPETKEAAEAYDRSENFSWKKRGKSDCYMGSDT